MGEVTLSADAVDAGSQKDFTITYKFTADVPRGLVEIKLPAMWADSLPPRALSSKAFWYS